MKKMLPIITLGFLLLTTPVIASRDKTSEKGEAEENQQITKCDPDANWKNHGEYVSCVTKLRLGGKVVSGAAKTDTGKTDRDDSDEEEAEASTAPSASPSASPFASPSVSPSASPSVSSSASPGAITESVSIEIKALVEVLKNILQSLQKLI